MTTLVVVDAHAGWPVEVTLEHGEPGTEKTQETRTVEPLNTGHFYIHSGCVIVGIKEMPKPPVEEAMTAQTDD